MEGQKTFQDFKRLHCRKHSPTCFRISHNRSSLRFSYWSVLKCSHSQSKNRSPVNKILNIVSVNCIEYRRVWNNYFGCDGIKFQSMFKSMLCCLFSSLSWRSGILWVLCDSMILHVTSDRSLANSSKAHSLVLMLRHSTIFTLYPILPNHPFHFHKRIDHNRYKMDIQVSKLQYAICLLLWAPGLQ